MYDQFICLSGLPRTGSTLLSAILSQNPLIHAEGNSAVCQLMWDMYISCTTKGKAVEQLLASNRQRVIYNLISQIPHIYYQDIKPKEKIIVDKCRSWTISANIQLLRKFIDENIKIIILERPIIEIVTSFAKLYKDNKVIDYDNKLEKLVQSNTEPIMRSIKGISWAKRNNEKNTFLFISYDDLIDNPKETISKIYTFCGWKPFKHNFKHIFSEYPENDAIYGLVGQHKIRSKISRRKLEVKKLLPEKIIKICSKIDNLILKI